MAVRKAAQAGATPARDSIFKPLTRAYLR